MFGAKRRGYRGDGAGHCWPNSPSGTGAIEDVFGPRFLNGSHDNHRGVDIGLAQGAPVYATLTGAVCRRHLTHFDFRTAAQLAQYEVAGSTLAAAHVTDHLELTCSRTGVASFPADIGRLQTIQQRICPKDDENWCIELNIPDFAVTGAIGFGLFSADLAERMCAEYDGATITLRGVGTTTFANDSATFAVADITWLRVGYTVATDTFYWKRSTDRTNWTTIASETGRSFASTLATHKPTLYWRSGDTNATPYTITVSELNWVDETQQTGRFGNYIFLQAADRKMCLFHLQEPVVEPGTFVHAGQIVGLAGKKGFDPEGGPVLHFHIHFEFDLDHLYGYNTDGVTNPIAPGIMPRVNVSNNVSVVRTRENDPDGADSHRLAITVQRADQDFDLNSVSLTGNLATRTVNWNTRAGLNPNNDLPSYDGVYILGGSLSTASTSYTFNMYFAVATVGTTFTSYTIADTAGTVLASG